MSTPNVSDSLENSKSIIEGVVAIGAQTWTLYTVQDSPKPFRMRRDAQDIPFSTIADRDAFVETALRIAGVIEHAPTLGTVEQVARQLGLVFTHNPVND